MGLATRLLISTSTFPLQPAGAVPQFVFNLAAGLTPHFEAVHVVAPGDASAPSREEMSGVHVRRFPYAWPRSLERLCYRSGIPSNLRQHPALAVLIPPFVLAQIAETAALCRRHSIGIVNSHWLVTQGFTAACARYLTPFRHVVQVHAADVYLLRRLPCGLGAAIARFVVRHSDRILCTSTYVRQTLDALLGFDSKAEICAMGVDYARFTTAAGPGTPGQILFFGRLVEKKGVRYLLEAFPIIRREHPNAALTIIGSGALEGELKNHAAELGIIGHGVQFVGAKNHDQIIEHLKHAQVAVFPSIIDSRGETEGMPTVVLEALAAGKRVVAGSVDGITDVLRDGKNGWLCRPRDPENLARKVLIALQPHDHISQRAQETARQYDWSAVCRRYAEALKPIS